MTYLQAITIFHTAISFVAIAAGFVAVAGLFHGGAYRAWTSLFLVTAIATSVTGFFFPFNGVTPAIVTGVVALIILAFVLLAYRRFRLVGAWRWIYAAGMVASLYLLVFVGVVQAFLKVPSLHSLAPTGAERPFQLTQLAVLLLFVLIGLMAAIRYRPVPVAVPVRREPSR